MSKEKRENKKLKKKLHPEVYSAIRAYNTNTFDILGSYTGIDKASPFTTPTQDVDDL
jgi:hypothetical protein